MWGPRSLSLPLLSSLSLSLFSLVLAGTAPLQHVSAKRTQAGEEWCLPELEREKASLPLPLLSSLSLVLAGTAPPQHVLLSAASSKQPTTRAVVVRCLPEPERKREKERGWLALRARILSKSMAARKRRHTRTTCAFQALQGGQTFQRTMARHEAEKEHE